MGAPQGPRPRSFCNSVCQVVGRGKDVWLASLQQAPQSQPALHFGCSLKYPVKTEVAVAQSVIKRECEKRGAGGAFFSGRNFKELPLAPGSGPGNGVSEGRRSGRGLVVQGSIWLAGTGNFLVPCRSGSAQE